MLDHRLTTGTQNMASIRKRGNSWQARVKRLGTEVEQSFKSKQAAERWARLTEVKIELGEYVHPTLDSEIAVQSLGEILQRFSNTVAPEHRSKTSKVNIRTLIRDLGHLNLEQVEPKAIAQWRDIKLKSIKPASVNRLLGTLGSVINHARKEWQLPIENPIPNIKRPSGSKARSRRFEGDEEQRLFRALNKRYIPIVRFALATGMRRGEILGLRWEFIDVKRCVALLPVTKNGHSRDVPLCTTAMSILEEVAGHSKYPVHGSVFSVNPITLDKAWRRACANAGISGLRLHDLRREAISRFFELGLSIPEAALISGHRTLSQLQVYTKIDASKLVSRLG